MQQQICIRPGDLEGRVRVPLSKSFLHRSLICAAMAGDLSLADLGEDILSDDISATKDCMQRVMSARMEMRCGRIFSENARIDFSCRESGSTLRFLVPLVAALGIPSHIAGERRLPQRPLGEYTEIFEGKGVRLDFPDHERYLPLLV